MKPLNFQDLRMVHVVGILAAALALALVVMPAHGDEPADMQTEQVEQTPVTTVVVPSRPSCCFPYPPRDYAPPRQQPSTQEFTPQAVPPTLTQEAAALLESRVAVKLDQQLTVGDSSGVRDLAFALSALRCASAVDKAANTVQQVPYTVHVPCTEKLKEIPTDLARLLVYHILESVKNKPQLPKFKTREHVRERETENAAPQTFTITIHPDGMIEADSIPDLTPTRLTHSY